MLSPSVTSWGWDFGNDDGLWAVFLVASFPGSCVEPGNEAIFPVIKMLSRWDKDWQVEHL